MATRAREGSAFPGRTHHLGIAGGGCEEIAEVSLGSMSYFAEFGQSGFQ